MRVDGNVFLVANAVPGDHIAFNPVQKRRGAARGQLSAIIEGSPDRVDPPCPVAGHCGGCALQFLSPDMHTAVKSEWVFDAFRKSLHRETIRVPAGQPSLHGRRRLKWYVGKDDEGCFLGFRTKTGHAVVRHRTCISATEALNALRHKLEASAEQLSLYRYESVQALQLDDGIHVVFEGHTPPHASAMPCREVHGLAIQWWHRQGTITVPLSKPVHTFHDLLPVGDERTIALQVGPDDFIQGQVEGNRQMIRQLLEWSEGARFVVDLFSGIGNLSLPVVAAHGARVVGAELNSVSVRAANANAKRLQLDATFMEANLFEQFNPEPFAGADVLILDPPRRGARKVCDMMGRLLPAKIIMVNCDVASGGRDGGILQSLGYRLHTLRALDMFPYTGHVEAMSLWVR